MIFMQLLTMASENTMEDIFVHTLYCDDLRQEIGGKQSFMGVYNNDMIVADFPANIPKLCTHIVVRLPIKTNANNLVIKVVNGDDVMSEVPIPEGDLQKMSAAILEASEDPAEVRHLAVIVHFQFAPLLLDQRSKLRAIAIVDGMEIKGNGLVVRIPTEAERVALGIPSSAMQ